MAFKLTNAPFPRKPSPKKLFGGGKPSSGYGSRPGERVGGKASAKADERRKKVDELPSICFHTCYSKRMLS